jgi:predicted nucleic acid-binding protein
MKVVSNTSPLINLAWIGRLEILHELYGAIQIPEAVWHEIVVQGAGQPGAKEVSHASWIETCPVDNKLLVLALHQELDADEAEAIALAIEQKSELLLMDERLGREAARYFGLYYTGVIGVLIEAKQKGLIGSIKEQLDSLRTIAGFHVSQPLYLKVLQDQGEL